MTGYAFLTVNVLLSSMGQILIKLGAPHVRYDRGIAAIARSMLFNKHIALGGLAVLCAPPFYFAALAHLELSAAYAFTGTNFVLVLLGSHLVLRERVTPLHFLGAALIMGGIAVFKL